ncbi:MAG: PqqD family protein [Rhodospirillaceae bacterium]|nr:PqqD family protein [Rhodospirillaceae bacterium]
MDSNEAPWLRIDDVRYVHNTVDGEVLVIDTEGGLYFSLRGAAAAIWPLLVAGTTRNDLHRAARAAFEAPADTIDAAVDEVIARMTAEGVLRQQPEDGSSPAPALARGAFEPPLVERYDDMRDLLTLDPIHEVSDAGWPNAQG